jgi:hypothetical protein
VETSPFLYIDKDFGVDDKGRIRLGETVSGGRNGRTITITEIGDVNTMSVVLGHEAYRDGKVGADNEQETRNAVIAHTKMAARMRAEGADFDNSFVGLDLAVYDYARSVGNMEIMEKYADMVYQSDGDYFDIEAIVKGKNHKIYGEEIENIGEFLGPLGTGLILQGIYNQKYGEALMAFGVEHNNTPDAASNNAERVFDLWNKIKTSGSSETIKEVAVLSELATLFNSMADGGTLKPVEFDKDVKGYLNRTTAVLQDGTEITFRVMSSKPSGNLPTIDIRFPKDKNNSKSYPWGKKNNRKIHITY